MLGQQRHHLVGAVAGALLDEAADLEVLAAAHRLGQHPVGHVADQHVLERQLALARQARLGAGREDVLLLQARSASPRSRPSSSASGASEPSQNVRPTTLACCTSRRSNGSSASSRAASTACTVSGQLGDPVALLLREAAHHLLGEQRVAAGALGHLRHQLAAAGPSRPSRAATSSRESSAAERVEEQLGGVAPPAAPARAALEQLVAGQADQQQRRAHPLRQVLDRVEHAVVGPVDVLEGQHQRLALRRRLDHRCAATEKNASRIRSGSPASAGACSAGTSRPSDRAICAAWRSGGSSGSTSRDVAAELAPRPRRSCRSPRSPPRRASPRRAPSRRCPCRRAGSGPCAAWRRVPSIRRSNSRSSRDLPTPASPTSVTMCGAPLAVDPGEHRLEHAELVVAAHQRRLLARTRGRPAERSTRPTASQAGTGSALPFSVSGSSSS